METKVCTKCKQNKPLSEYTKRSDRNNKYMTACKNCRSLIAKENRTPRHRLKHSCKSDSLRWHKEQRNTRTKNATLQTDLEWDFFFFKEIHDLRRLRNKITGFSWHVDHIIPLCNSQVCGLHYWKNLRLIPATENWRKNNAFYD